MNYPDYLWLLFGMGIVTYLPRVLPLVFLAERNLPEGLRDWLSLIPVAILAALLAPGLLIDSSARTLALGKPELLAAIPTLFLALRTRSLGLSVIFGMAFYWVIQHWL
ncbi:MAG: AzlD domain-containing protein [Desulfuromonadales bacterium]|nr:AzlD domain-containing protein [Desulfuromonadales bacterium]